MRGVHDQPVGGTPDRGELMLGAHRAHRASSRKQEGARDSRGPGQARIRVECERSERERGVRNRSLPRAGQVECRDGVE